MGTVIKWVQLSDIHFQSMNEGIQTELLRDKLIAYLKTIRGCNALILSGDYRYAPTGEKNPQNCAEFIMALARSLNVDNNQIVVAPGNHDLERGVVRDYLIQGVKNAYDPEKGLIDKPVLAQLIGGFEFYYELCSRLEGVHAIKINGFPHDIVHLEECDVLLLDTALASGSDGESGQLVIGSSDIFKLLSERERNKPIIAVGHHSLTELNKEERKAVERLFEDNDIQLYLCGHAHNPEYRTFGNHGEEITVGCIKQNERDVLATFVVGEITDTGDVIIRSHIWDMREKNWFPDVPRDRDWKALYKEIHGTREDPKTVKKSDYSFSLKGYSFLGPLGRDGIKYLWSKGGKTVESVALNQRVKESPTEEDMHTSAYTISTSIGCLLATTGQQCRFCGTGTKKFGGLLTARDIAMQCVFMAEYDSDCPQYKGVRNNAREFAFMGQGEPGFNYPAIREAIRMTDYVMKKLGQNVSRYIISTCGITDFMPALIDDIRNGVFQNKVTVHFSLHEIGRLRQELMPINELYSYEDFIKQCETLYSITGDRIGIGILMFDNYRPSGSNERAYTLTGDRLLKILKYLDRRIFRIDLCAVNSTNAGSQDQLSYDEAIELYNIVKQKGFEGKIFTSFGDTQQSGCGMLCSQAKDAKTPGNKSTTHFNIAVDLIKEAEKEYNKISQ